LNPAAWVVQKRPLSHFLPSIFIPSEGKEGNFAFDPWGKTLFISIARSGAERQAKLADLAITK
jgi:hypothetical protein